MPIPKKKVSTASKKTKEEVILENEDLLEEDDEIVDEDDFAEEEVVEEEVVDDEDVEEAETEEDDEEEEEIPAPKKVVKKATPAKKTVAKKATKPEKKETVKEERKLTKDDIAKAKKIISANAVESFAEAMESGKFNVDLEGKTSATRNDLVKVFINNLSEVINGEDEGKSKHITQLLNLNDVTIANCETLYGVFEKTFMDMVERQMTFVFGYNPSTNGLTSIKRRTIEGRAFNSLGKTPTYTPFYATMKLEYPIGKEVIKGEYDESKGVFISEDGKKYDIAKENSKAIATDKKNFPRNYPSHLSKK